MELIDLRNGLTVADLLSLAGAAIVVAIIVELLKRTLAWSPEFTARFAPLAACVTGTVLSVLAAVWLSRDPVQAALTGFLAGALAGGLYDLAAERIGALWAKVPKPGGTAT
jgi:hypothetical protein